MKKIPNIALIKWVFGILVLLILLVLNIFIMINKKEPQNINTIITFEMSNRKFFVPSNLLAYQHDIQRVKVNELELILDYTLENSINNPEPFNVIPSINERIAIKITPISKDLDPDLSLEKIYSRFLGRETNILPNGLLQRNFREETPYSDQELYLGAGKLRKFIALCHLPSKNEVNEIELCNTRFKHDAFEIEIRFPQELLKDWRQLTQKLEDKISSFLQEPSDSDKSEKVEN